MMNINVILTKIIPMQMANQFSLIRERESFVHPRTDDAGRGQWVNDDREPAGVDYVGAECYGGLQAHGVDAHDARGLGYGFHHETVRI